MTSCTFQSEYNMSTGFPNSINEILTIAILSTNSTVSEFREQLNLDQILWFAIQLHYFPVKARNTSKIRTLTIKYVKYVTPTIWQSLRFEINVNGESLNLGLYVRILQTC